MKVKLGVKIKYLAFILVAFAFLMLSISQTSAARLFVSPQSDSFIKGCSYSLQIQVDPQGQPVNAAEFQLQYNPSQITITDASSQSGTQIEPSDAFPVVLGNSVSSGVITFSAGTPPLQSITSTTTLASINFTVSNSASSMATTFLVDGFGAQYTTDSNVAHAQTNQDILTSVGNGSFTFVNGTCETIPPQINFDNPEAYSYNVDLNSDIIITITDDGSGVDIDTVRIYINGVLYLPSDPEVSFTGDPSSYTFVISPNEEFGEDDIVTVSVEATDLAGNSGSRSTTFNTIGICPIDPDVICANYDVSVSGGGIAGDDNLIDISVSDDGFIDLATAGSSAALVLGAIPLLLSLLSLPGAILKFFGVLLGRKQDKPWGIVKDAVTGKPLAFAVCELYSEGSSYKSNQVVSDLEGRYGFTVEPGSYRMEVKKTEYKPFVTSFQIGQGQDRYIYDVEMSPLTSDMDSKISLANKIKTRVVKAYNRLTKWLFIIGFIISTISVVLDQRFLNLLILALYLFIIFLIMLPKLRARAKYATVVSTKTNLRIPFAQIKIFEAGSMKLIDTKTTNQDGYFDFYGEPGTYALLVIVRGFKFPSDQNTFARVGPANSMLSVDLTRGGNRITLYVDPSEGVSRSDSNIQSPFS